MESREIIRCEGLVKIYKVANLEVFALQGLDLVVQRGEMLGIVGASGSGKTTLMNILGGLDRPSAGKLWVDGSNMLNLTTSALNRYRRTKVGFVWQQGARNLVPYLSALENVELPMMISGKFSQWGHRKRSLELLDTVGLIARKNHRLVALSGGEQQRVAIAVALANQPELLLADEPTGEVDTETASEIFKTFRDISQRSEVTVIIVSHDPTIAQYVNRVVAIRDGKPSTETVRQQIVVDGATQTAQVPESISADKTVNPTHAEIFQEVTLVDSAGRLQVPREYLERLGVTGRVLLELTETGVLIRPAPDSISAQSNLPKPEHNSSPSRVNAGQNSLVKQLRGWRHQ